MIVDSKNRAPTAQQGERDDDGDELSSWLDLARKAYDSSTTYVDSNYRKTLDDSIRAFNNQHPSDAKYSQPSYDKRSKIFRPRTRSVIRKNEAAGAAAFFSNMDVVSVLPQDPSDKKECTSADVMKELLQYRLTKSIPWYQTVLGGLQDAQVTGAVCAHIYWDYQEEVPEEQEISEYEYDTEDKDEEFPNQEDSTLPDGAIVVGLANPNPGVVPLTPMGMPTPQPLPPQQPPMMQPGMQPQMPPPGQAPNMGTMSPNMGQPSQGGMPPPQPNPPVPTVDRKIIKDKPVIELIPLENIRIDPAASWIDPVSTSPYIIHLIPMYILDVKEKMESGEWRKLSDSKLAAATDPGADSTRSARQKGNDDPYKNDSMSVDEYAIVWVQRHIHRKERKDWEFYTLSDIAMLSEPRLLTEVVFHGMRPYVLGSCILETHKVFPSSIPTLGKGLQDEINEVANQRIDNVKFVLNKKWLVKRGKEADVAGLVRNVPGGVVMLDDPTNDVREINWTDVTSSAFQEQQSLNMEMDELLGNFNPAALMQANGQAPVKNMAMLSQSSGTLVEYLLRTFVETFVQPVLRQLVRLEQEYETDQVILKIAAKRANIFQKYGVNQITDDLLNNELTLTVNVGMGATDPMQKLQKFIMAMTTYTGMLQKPAPGIDMKEVGKEIFGHLGYSDGSRFFTVDNPQVAAMQQQLMQANQMIQQLQMKVKDHSESHMTKKQIAEMNAKARIEDRKIRESNENMRNATTHLRAIRDTDKKHQHEAILKAAEIKRAKQTLEDKKPPPPPQPKEPKPPIINIHIPETAFKRPAKKKTMVERDDKGELVGSNTEYDYGE